MVRKRQSLEGWIREAMIVDASSHGGPITAIALVHMKGMSQDEIYTARFGGTPQEPRELSELFQHKAESYAQDLSGTQTFCLIAFYNNSNEPGAKHPFAVTSQQDFSNDLVTEGPNGTGVLQQMMRHYEVQTQATFKKDGMLTEALLRTVGEQNLTITALLRENREALELAKVAVLQYAANEHEHKMKEKEYERATLERQMFFKYLPPLANTILGKEVFPVGTEDTAIIEAIAESLTEDQAKKLAENLPPTVVGIIFNRLEKSMKTKQLKNAQTQRLIRGKNPEDDAAGD